MRALGGVALQRLPFLKEKFPEASYLLEFMDSLLRLQAELLDKLPRIPEYPEDTDWSLYIPHLRAFMEKVASFGTPEIEEGIHLMSLQGDEELKDIIVSFLKNRGGDGIERLVLIGFLQPVFRKIAETKTVQRDGWLKNECPVCGFKPCVSFLADTSEGEGTRFLRCGLCLSDWVYVRTKCVKCGNVEDNTMDYFISEDIDYVSLQVCQKCKHYIKVVDMRRDGFAVPELEDIATVSLDLWAGEKGLTKFERNILGM
ncbi:MAG TPA: formate dehydrogenase accessory protein FdhE [Aquifex aeolicus]|nr:formate dehydrogenase accessory protein FdhE [Aquifex aeolicus]